MKTIIWYILGLVGNLVLKLIIVGILEVKREIIRVLGVETIIIGIHLTKKKFKTLK